MNSKHYSWNPSPETALIEARICLFDFRNDLDGGLRRIVTDLGDTVRRLHEDGAEKIVIEYSNEINRDTNPDRMCPTITVRAERPPENPNKVTRPEDDPKWATR